MKTHTGISKYRLLVLMDTSKNAAHTLKDAVHLAKLIDGSIDVFQVQQPLNVVRFENQIATMRNMDEERYKKEMLLKETVTNLKKEAGVPIISNFTIGNVKNEIKSHIEKTQPDIVVLGKRKKKVGGFLGDKVTKEILTNFNGSVFISDKEYKAGFLESQSIGFLDTIDGADQIALVNDLKQYIQKPLKIFKAHANNAMESKKATSVKSEEKEFEEKAIVYEFDASINDVSDMSRFISKNNLALLCLHKNAKENDSIKGRFDTLLTKTIEKVKVPVLVLNTNLN